MLLHTHLCFYLGLLSNGKMLDLHSGGPSSILGGSFCPQEKSKNKELISQITFNLLGGRKKTKMVPDAKFWNRFENVRVTTYMSD